MQTIPTYYLWNFKLLSRLFLKIKYVHLYRKKISKLQSCYYQHKIEIICWHTLHQHKQLLFTFYIYTYLYFCDFYLDNFFSSELKFYHVDFHLYLYLIPFIIFLFIHYRSAVYATSIHQFLILMSMLFFQLV